MDEILSALIDPNFPFLRYALIAGIFSSICFGIIGSLIVTRRLVSLAGAISHSVLAGVGIVLFLVSRYPRFPVTPFQGAMITAVFCALVLAGVTRLRLGREDTVIGAIWAMGMAVGMVFLAYTPGYIDPMSYLFGSMLLISEKELVQLIFLSVAIVVLVVLFYPQIWALCFDEEYSIVRNIPVRFLHTLLLILCAVTVVMMMPMIGIVLVLAQLTLPVLTAEIFALHLYSLFFLSSIICAVTTVSGIMLSYFLDLPAGPVIILLSGFVYICSLCARWLARKALNRKF